MDAQTPSLSTTMARIEELPDNSPPPTASAMPSDSSAAGLTPDMLAAASPFPPKAGAQPDTADPALPSAPMPPAMAAAKSYTADELVTMLNRTPLFMTELDETDGAGGENVELEALKALAYEGTRAEVADNFRTQGNDMARAKNWRDAREFYTRALAALRGEAAKEEPEKEEGEGEARRGIEEACCVNRALCNLEMSRLFPFVLASPPRPHPYRRRGVLTHVPRTRKLQSMQPRLRRRHPPEPAQRQGLLPLRDGMPGH